MRRGFKKEAEQHAIELRRELELADVAPLCPWRLAKHLEIPIHTLTTITAFEPDAVEYLRGRGRKHFSAVTLFGGNHGLSRVICHNESHALTRQRSNLAHELAHAILLHPPTVIFKCDPESEAEAAWLGPALLVSSAAAIKIAMDGTDYSNAANAYGTSTDLMRMRLGVTGATTIAKRKRAKLRSQ
ncbi:ImmA/IrrE family metallo-endopeptidase [Gimesia maris]|uniref:ImmA/IrrE family metallo-endopeptidase n=1 Tax=Gimesia maris TaxID=122 RepID=UPI003A8F4469